MKLQFVGAATTVTGSQFLLTTDRARVLVDCGMFQGSPSEVERNRVPFPYDPAQLDVVLVTHAHLDHCGLIPLLVKEGFRGPIYLTRATAELTSIVLLDSAKVQKEQARERRRRDRRDRAQHRRAEDAAIAHHEAVRPFGAPEADHEAVVAATRRAPVSSQAPPPGPVATEVAERRRDARRESDRRGRGFAWPPPEFSAETGFDPEAALRRQPPSVETEIFQPLYDTHDAERAIAAFRALDYEQATEVADGIRATFRDAGHILGSAIITVDAREGDAERRIVFSGDLGRPNTPIIRDPTVIRDGADYVLVESTYGGREHEPGDEAIRLLAEVVRAVAESSGVLLVPSFAIGRTQEVVWQLDRLLAAGQIPHVPLYLDSPMAMRATDIYRRFPGYFDDATFRLLQSGETPLDYPGEMIVRTASESRAIADAVRPHMIIASNGMLTGGRVLDHFRDLVEDPAAVLLFVGYQGEGTLGAHLQAGAREVRVNGRLHPVRCQVRSISGFSAHADEGELLAWLRAFASAPRRPRRVFLVHGDPKAQTALEPRIREIGLSAHRPSWREEVVLD